MEAGMTINAMSVQLLGGSTDAVPRRLYDVNGVQHDVQKYYMTDVKDAKLQSLKGEQFQTDAKGWISKVETDNSQQNSDGSASEVF